MECVCGAKADVQKHEFGVEEEGIKSCECGYSVAVEDHPEENPSDENTPNTEKPDDKEEPTKLFDLIIDWILRALVKLIIAFVTWVKNLFV